MEKRTHQVLGIVVLVGAVLFGPGLCEFVRLSWIERRLDRELTELTNRREQLVREEQRLQSDPTYVEGLIRSTFKVAQPGEYVIALDNASQSR